MPARGTWPAQPPFSWTPSREPGPARLQVRHDPGRGLSLGGLPCRFGQRNFIHSAVVPGPTKLHGAEITVPDLRGGFSYLIAALAAEGTSRVHGVDLIYRGYERFQDKLEALGART